MTKIPNWSNRMTCVSLRMISHGQHVRVWPSLYSKSSSAEAGTGQPWPEALWCSHSDILVVSPKMEKGEKGRSQCSTNTTVMISLPFLFFHSYFSPSLVSLVLPHLLAPLCNLCLCHLWHQPARQHLCQAWQPKPRRSAWLSSIDSFRQLHPDSDLYGGSLIYPRPLCEGSNVFCLMYFLLFETRIYLLTFL